MMYYSHLSTFSNRIRPKINDVALPSATDLKCGQIGSAFFDKNPTDRPENKQT